MATIRFIDGRLIEHVRLTDVKAVGDEGSQSATAHYEGKEYHVYNSVVDGINVVWHEQRSGQSEEELTLTEGDMNLILQAVDAFAEQGKERNGRESTYLVGLHRRLAALYRAGQTGRTYRIVAESEE